MKKTFSLVHPKIKPARLADSVKSEVRRYLKRERNKTLPEGANFWDFTCKYGPTAESAKVIHANEIPKYIEEAESKKLESFYIEILATPGHRTKRPEPQSEQTPKE
jgi:hypothetical protein